jgi:hypothetical protein
VETALGGGTTTDHTRGGHTEQATDDGQIVIIQPQVVENVGHVLGNLFQRIYHLIDRARETDIITAQQLEGSTRRLEGFLQLVIDYVSPLSLSLQRVPATEIAQSLAARLSDAVGRTVSTEAKLPIDGQLLVDPGRIARGFGLLAAQLQEGVKASQPIVLTVASRPTGRWLVLTVAIPSGCVVARSSESEMQWSVAQKLLEIQGGSVQQRSTDSGEVLWEIVLPLQP